MRYLTFGKLPFGAALLKKIDAFSAESEMLSA
jgi:hypothetical protein